MKFSIIEKLYRMHDRAVYTATSAVKSICGLSQCAGKVYFGTTHQGSTTASNIKARRLADLFGNSSLRNNILYVCSANIPFWYCLKEKKRGVKLVLNQNGVYYPGWYGANYAVANDRNLAQHYRAADYVIYQSNFCEMSSRRYLGDPLCPHEVLYNPVDTALFKPGIRRKHNLSAPIFISTGNYYSDAQKERIRLMLKAFELVRAQYPLSRLIVAGKIYKGLRKLLSATSTGVEYIGPYTSEQAPEIYRMGDVYLNTQFNDVCPSAVLEAMSTGLPIVYLDCGGTPELVDNAGTAVPVEKSWECYLYPEPELYAAAMVETVKQRNDLGSVARDRCLEMFDIRLWKQRHEEIFKRLSG